MFFFLDVLNISIRNCPAILNLCTICIFIIYMFAQHTIYICEKMKTAKQAEGAQILIFSFLCKAVCIQFLINYLHISKFSSSNPRIRMQNKPS